MLPPARAFYALLLLIGPVYVSGFVNLLRDAVPEVAVVPKEAVSLTLAVCVLWPSGWLAERRRFCGVMGAMAVVILGHTLLGIYQLYVASRTTSSHCWPCYRNPSFKAMESWSDEYARYIKRPCGLFPEPSAMAASLGPYVVVLAGLMADPGAVRRFGLGRPYPMASSPRPLFAVGSLLLALSRSGLTAAVLGAVLAVSLGNACGPGSVRPGPAWSWPLVAATVAAVGGMVSASPTW